MDFRVVSCRNQLVLWIQKQYFMVSNHSSTALAAVLLSVVAIASAEAQAPLGSRASGMAGAFVGVADDASAVYWNPAGIATGAFVSLVADLGRQEAAPETPQTSAGERHSARIMALSMTAIGLAYYRLGTYGTETAEPAVTAVPSREEVRRRVQALTTSTVGVSLLQSLTDHIVVAVTPKIMRGSARQSVTADTRGHEALDTAASLEGRGSTVFDVDAGVMIAVNRIRLGLVARNLTTPAFAKATAGRPGDGSGEIELEREVRVGGAWGSGWSGRSRVIVAVDGDLTSRQAPRGERRDVAAGVETWWKNQRLGLRGGVRRSTMGDARAAVAGGVSAGVTAGMLLEAHVVRGQSDEHSWSVGARFTF